MAVLQLVKDDAKRRRDAKSGGYEPHMVVNVYDDHEITEPASPGSRLYFLTVDGAKEDYLYLLEDNTDEDIKLGAKRKKHKLKEGEIPEKKIKKRLRNGDSN